MAADNGSTSLALQQVDGDEPGVEVCRLAFFVQRVLFASFNVERMMSSRVSRSPGGLTRRSFSGPSRSC